jgi:hypothetical protein
MQSGTDGGLCQPADTQRCAVVRTLYCSSGGAHAYPMLTHGLILPAWMLQAQAGQDGGGDRRSHTWRPRRPRPELVLHVNTAQGLQQMTDHKVVQLARSNAAKSAQGGAHEEACICMCW